MRGIITVIFLPALLLAQDLQFQLETDSIPVTMEGWSPCSPWAGGVSESNPAIVDIDNDGDLDFFIGEYFGQLQYFLNLGTSQVPEFHFFSAQYASILMQESRANPCFRDLDSDEDLDLLVGDIDSNLRFYRNLGTSQIPDFFLEDSSLIPGPPWWGIGPELVDIDADGDYDLFGGYYGQISFYQNMGTPQIFDFSLVTQSFSGINVGDRALPEFTDIDADGDYDLFIGEEFGQIWFYRNDGDSANYNFTYVTNSYFGIDAGDYSSPEFADIDGDGDYDLFVGREANPASLIGDVFFYENVGTPQNAQFQLVAKDYLMLDFSIYEPRPQFIDINADGNKEMIAGAGNVLDYFENAGDSLQPEFIFTEQGYQGIYLPTIQPFLVDIDADGDYDLFCGQGAIPGPPSLALYLNQGSPRNPDFQLYSNQFITNPNFFVLIVPVLADIDADGDYDLFIFDSQDHFYYYQNNGTSQWPSFVLMTNQWQGIHQFPYPYNSWYGFSFADLDQDQDLDLLIGSPEQDNLYFYRNMGTPQTPNMVLQTETLLPESYPYIYTPYLVDIDSDEDYDLFVGHTNGGILFFRNITGDSTGVRPGRQTTAPYRGPVLSIGPNPANPLTVISCKMQVASNISLEIFDISGKKVVELASGLHLPGEYRYVWDASKNASGMYVIRLGAGEEKRFEKLVLLK